MKNNYLIIEFDPYDRPIETGDVIATAKTYDTAKEIAKMKAQQRDEVAKYSSGCGDPSLYYIVIENNELDGLIEFSETLELGHDVLDEYENY